MFRSATFKLTMWYLALVMIISVAFSVVLYHVTTAELARGLHHETERIFTQFPVFNNGNSPLLQPNDDLSSGTHRLLLRLIGFNIIVFFGAGFASFWLARRTLMPIEEAHEQQKRFTADVSHELRTPLTALKMESEVALMNPKTSPKELRQTLESNLEEANKLESLINSLMRLTRLEADELQQHFKPLSVADIAAQAVKQVQKIATNRRITVQDDTKAALIDGEQDSLVQLFVILLDNAVKYSPADTTLSLESHREGDRIIIQIKDQGIGIERASLERVFDRFYRADNSRTKTDTEGFGLGLSIAKMITDVHHGTIVLTSRVAHGTTATINLPAHSKQQ